MSPRPKVLISVGSSVNHDRQWAVSMCEKVLQAISKNVAYDAQCVRLDVFDEMIGDPIGAAQRSGEFRYHIQVRDLELGAGSLQVENWSAREDEGEFERVGWSIRFRDDQESGARISALLGNLMDYERDKPYLKTLFLAAGLGGSSRLKVDADGKVRDVRTRVELDDARAYSIFLAESPRNKNYLRAASEVAVSLGAATAHYWSSQLFRADGKNPNTEDWQYGGLSGQRRRWKDLDGIRFDDNSRGVNVGHAYAGMWYYQLARSNQLTSMESFLYTFTASALWEVASEYREVISINDQIITPVAGMVIGETLHQFGRYFHSKGTLAGKVLSTVFDSPAAINRLLDSRSPQGLSSARKYGFDPAAFGYMDFYAGQASGSHPDSPSGTVLGLSGEILNIPLFEETGKVRALYTDTVFSKLLVQSTGSNDATKDFQALSKVVFAAFHQKSINEQYDGSKRGYSMFIGVASGAEYSIQGKGLRRDEPKDWSATVHVVGTTLDYTVLVPGKVKVRAVVDVYGDFAMVRSYSIDAFKAANPDTAGLASVLESHDYYYAWGITSALSLSASRGAWSGGYSIRDSSFSSIDDRSRFQEKGTTAPHLEDSKRDQEVWVAYDANNSVRLRFSVIRREREGTMDGGTTISGSDTIRMGSINFRF